MPLLPLQVKRIFMPWYESHVEYDGDPLRAHLLPGAPRKCSVPLWLGRGPASS